MLMEGPLFAEPISLQAGRMSNDSYDLIGDIHGEAGVLRDLLGRLGYREQRGCYRHSSRRVIFLGDYIDRGPAIRETLHIVRAMVDHGESVALCGNHELDILMHDTSDGQGGWLRAHGANTAMHARTHAEFASRSDEWRGWLGWIQSLPLYLELPGLRAVHACWDDTAVAVLQDRRRLDDALLMAVAAKHTAESIAVNALLKGREVPLPDGVYVTGREGRRFQEMRVRWWQDGRGRTYREACINRHDPGPDLMLPPGLDPLLTPPTNADRPIFIGHYWLPPQIPTPLTGSVACLDYSVAAGGPLVAYRWDGERELTARKFVFDEQRLDSFAHRAA
jgi:Calcineurin-like phosphoesterase